MLIGGSVGVALEGPLNRGLVPGSKLALENLVRLSSVIRKSRRDSGRLAASRKRKTIAICKLPKRFPVFVAEPRFEVVVTMELRWFHTCQIVNLVNHAPVDFRCV